MPTITAIDRPLIWAVHDGADIIESGQTLVGETTIVAEVNQLSSDSDENALLNALATANVSAPTLPAAGAALEQSDIYDYAGTLYMVRQSHTRTSHDPATVPALFTFYRVDAGDALDWVTGEQVYVGTRRVYDSTVYECIQAHQTQDDWTPDVTPVLWSVVVDETPGEWMAGVAYTGDNTAGAGNGDVVTYQGADYRCLQSHTALAGFTPPVVPALWLAI